MKPIAVPSGYTIATVGEDGTALGDWVDSGDGVFTLTGAYGALTYDSAANALTYELTTAPKEIGAGANLAYEVVRQVTLNDADGNSFPLPVRIGIYDDLPEATFTGSGGTLSGHTFIGAWEVAYGADGAAGTGALELIVSLGGGGSVTLSDLTPGSETIIKIGDVTYGTLTLKTDGTYTFAAEPNTTGDLRFTLYATDADGDRVSSGDGFVLKIEEPQGPGVTQLGGREIDKVSESALPDGTHPDGDALTHPLPLPDGYTVVTDNRTNWIDNGDGTFTLNGAHGRLTYTEATDSLTYTLTAPATHAAQGADKAQEVIEGVVLRDEFGNTYTVEASVGIVDDVPEVNFARTEASIWSGADHSGTVTVNYGADDSGGLSVTVSHPGATPGSEITLDVTPDVAIAVLIDGVNYGRLTFAGDGSYIFEAEPNVNGTLNIALTATDGDGDVTTGTFTLNIVNPQGPGLAYIGYGEDAFEEKNFDNGTEPNIGALTRPLSLPDGYTVDVKGAGSPWTATTAA
jgi:hypothetical protein